MREAGHLGSHWMRTDWACPAPIPIQRIRAWLIGPVQAMKVFRLMGERLQDTADMKRRIGDALRAGSIAERERLVAFVVDEATSAAANPFPLTTAGAAHQRWGLREIEFEAMGVASAGLRCLMVSLGALPVGEPLRQEILRSPTHVLYVLWRGEVGVIVGAVLHGNPGQALPLFVQHEPVARRAPAKRSSRRRVAPGQLELFAIG